MLGLMAWNVGEVKCRLLIASVNHMFLPFPYITGLSRVSTFEYD